ncbi:Tungstate uptake system ATP-binding protein TupC [Sulfurospirillum diekertiae]|uniref:Tungstate uptake system ATP-binding protein TupC n=1 Tax=Sulfurospirillum diekertiae TaxID=1854492 RepID=A0A1Y0HNY1_9BACT|nr:ABC transporter ATP-binding protein [Sulfurospirillum diekertiae]ARU49791.1 Tungstate uptake system ATP-binding protein TupC [Sulfurospirillum diekertiae]
MNTVMYELKNLRTLYGEKPVLDIQTLQVYEGEILGLVGSNGSGKSTLLRHLAFLEAAQSGTLCYRGFDASSIPLSLKREIGILLPEPYLLKRSVRENLLFGLKIRGTLEDAPERMNEALELVGLLPKKFLHRAWHELSSGETQRVALASRLVLHPKMLLLDEPTNSLDYSGVPQFTDAILHANQVWGTTIVIASHDLLWLNEIATRKVGLHFGRLMDFSTTNLIVGKWRESGDERFFDFDENQSMSLPKSYRIGEKRGVAINPRDISVSIEPFTCKDDTVYLTGIIRDVLHVTKTNEISLKIVIGNHLLECVESFEYFKRYHFYPSQNVYVSFAKSAIKVPSKEA